MQIKIAGAAVLLPLLLWGCSGIANAERGTYTATITGAVDMTLTGRAVLERGVGLAEFEYAIHMFLPERGPEYGIFLFFPERPKVGTYRVVDQSARSLRSGEVSAAAIIGGIFTGSSGEVRITSSDPLRGTFEFLQEPRAGGSTPELTARGEFTLR